jgi:MFS family permease
MRLSVNEEGNWRSFRHRNYQILFPANAVSNIGSWAQRIAQDWLVLELTHSGTYLGLVTALQFAPVLLFSLHGGALADRFNKRRVLIATNIAGGLSSAVLGILVMAGVVALWHVFLLAFALGVSTAIDGPVRQSFTNEVVGPDDLPNAVSLNSANFNAGRLIGPAVSGFLIAAFGTGPSFLFNAFSYLFVILALTQLNEKAFFTTEKSTSMTNVREGIAYVRARPDLYVVMAMVFFIATFGLNFQIFNALMATKVFGKGPASYGLLGTFIAIGSLSGALISARLEGYRKTLFVVRAGMVFSLVVIILSLMPTYLAYAFWLPVCGLAALTTLITANSIVQVNTDPAIRGRVMGLYLLIFMGGTPFGSPLIGVMAELIGTRETIAACGAIALTASMAIYLNFRNKIALPEDISIAAVLKAINSDKNNNSNKGNESN